jgi:hypothetical protein
VHNTKGADCPIWWQFLANGAVCQENIPGALSVIGSDDDGCAVHHTQNGPLTSASAEGLQSNVTSSEAQALES